jgi:hypothetical protein
MTQSTSLILAQASPDVRMPEFAPFVVVAFGVKNVLIGHENSALHGKIYFALPPGTS